MAFAGLCALLGVFAGGLVPSWVRRLPEPAGPSAASVTSVVADAPSAAVGTEPPVKPPYVHLARWPRLRPLAAVLVALSWAFIGLRFGPTPIVAALCYLCLIGMVVGYVDVRVHLLPNAVLLPSYVVVAVLLLIAAGWSGAWERAGWAAIGGAALWLFFVLLVMIYPAGMGFGDAKLAGLLGAGLGWFGLGHVVLGLFAAFVLGGLTGLVLIVARRADRKSAIPFGPFLLAGFAVAVLLGDPIVAWYVGA